MMAYGIGPRCGLLPTRMRFTIRRRIYLQVLDDRVAKYRSDDPGLEEHAGVLVGTSLWLDPDIEFGLSSV